jgi:hypothetical protein
MYLLILPFPLYLGIIFLSSILYIIITAKHIWVYDLYNKIIKVRCITIRNFVHLLSNTIILWDHNEQTINEILWKYMFTQNKNFRQGTHFLLLKPSGEVKRNIDWYYLVSTSSCTLRPFPSCSWLTGLSTSAGSSTLAGLPYSKLIANTRFSVTTK